MAALAQRKRPLDPANLPNPVENTVKKAPDTERFSHISTEEDMAEMAKGFTPVNTLKNTSWAVKVFRDWQYSRNARVSDKNKCPENLLEKPVATDLNRWICRFIDEARRKDGAPYPPKTIHQLLCGLQRYMLDHTPDAPKFMDQKDVHFRDIRGTCDTVFRKLHSEGVGADTRHTPIITADEQDRLWSSGVLSDDNPQSLQYAVFFYVGKVFCIRGGEEQRRLGPSQLVRSKDPDCYTYIEHESKNRTGGLLQLRVDNKAVPCYAVPDSSPTCLVHLLDTYLAKLPSLAFEQDYIGKNELS